MTPTIPTREELQAVERKAIEETRAAEEEVARLAGAQERLQKAKETRDAAQALLRNLYGEKPPMQAIKVSSITNGRPQDKSGLTVAEIATKILHEKPGLTTADLTDEIQRRGKKFNAQTPWNSVWSIMSKNADKFEKKDKKWYVRQSV